MRTHISTGLTRVAAVFCLLLIGGVLGVAPGSAASVAATASAASGSTGTTSLTKSPVSPGAAHTYQVRIRDGSITPTMLDARVGDTISWVNLGKVAHRVSAKDGSFAQTLQPGERFTFVLSEQGDISYVCTGLPGGVGMLMVGPSVTGAPDVAPSTPGALTPGVASAGVFLALFGIGWFTTRRRRTSRRAGQDSLPTHGSSGFKRVGALISLLLVAGVLAVVGSSASVAATRTVKMGSTLSPQDITVRPGTTITWTSVDGARHKVRSSSGPQELKSDDITPGQSWSFTFTATGTYTYVDDENKDDPAMHGTVTVRTGGGGGGPGNPNPPPGGPGGGGGPTAPAKASVSLANKAFSPRTVTIAAGGVVTWTNNDQMPHTVTSTSGAFNSPILNSGGTFKQTFTKPGTYPYICTLHSGMGGTVIVLSKSGSAPPPAPPAPPGSPGSPGSPPTGGTQPAPPAGPGSVTHGQTKTYRVTIHDNFFSPSVVHARVGDTITWVNAGAMPHTVTAGNGAFDHMVSPGQSFSYALRAAGSISYVCSFHPGMNGSLVVGAALPGVAVPPAVADPGGGGGGPGVSGGTTTPAAAAPASHGKTETIEIKVNEMSFSPATVTAHVGDTISWVNVGAIPHTVTAGDGSFDKTPIAPGERYSWVVTKEGAISYVCSYHPGMNGSLVLKPALAGVKAPPATGATATAGTTPLTKAPVSTGTAHTYEVQVKDDSFTPAMLEAHVGDTISWVNLGQRVHTVTAKDGSFDKTLKPGQRFNLVLTREGTINYVCTPHHAMFGMLMVGPRVTGDVAPSTLGAVPPLIVSGAFLLLILGGIAAAQVRRRRHPV